MAAVCTTLATAVAVKAVSGDGGVVEQVDREHEEKDGEREQRAAVLGEAVAPVPHAFIAGTALASPEKLSAGARNQRPLGDLDASCRRRCRASGC